MQPTITALLKENVQFRMLNHQNIIRYYETEILEAKDQSHLLSLNSDVFCAQICFNS